MATMLEHALPLLTVNAGSSSIRLAAFQCTSGGPQLLAAQHAEVPAGSADDGPLRDFLQQHMAGGAAAVAHRVVHGGAQPPGAHRIDEALEQAIVAHIPLAPLHNPAALQWIRACRGLLPGAPQLAVFDTGLFHALPEVAARYALPDDLVQRHALRRYGFHGLAHASMLRRWTDIAPHGGRRVISLQLGSGCSAAASRDGQAVDTSMGFSPLEGLVMATRSGDVDPGLLLYLLRHGDMTAEDLEASLNRRSGLLGLSGHSADMRLLIDTTDEASQLAVELFAYRARKYVGAYLAVLGGADAILFGGGVGEHEPRIRRQILAGMEWAGTRLDDAANMAARGGHACISAADSPVAVHVVAVDEAHELATSAQQVLDL